MRNLRRIGMLSETILDVCLLCGKDGEIVDHIFLHCERGHVVWCFPVSKDVLRVLFEGWRWMTFSYNCLILWNLIPFVILWLVWKERNN